MTLQDTELDNNDGASHPESTMLAPPQNIGAGPGPKGLPRAVYNGEWVAKQIRLEKRRLEISKEPFEWISLRQTG
jgi:hypothetical protein